MIALIQIRPLILSFSTRNVRLHHRQLQQSRWRSANALRAPGQRGRRRDRDGHESSRRGCVAPGNRRTRHGRRDIDRRGTS